VGQIITEIGGSHNYRKGWVRPYRNSQLNKPHVIITKGLSIVITPAFALRSYMTLHILIGRVLLFAYVLLTFAQLILSGAPIWFALIGTGIAFFFGKIAFDQFEKLNTA
jgi:hypothetical protein